MRTYYSNIKKYYELPQKTVYGLLKLDLNEFKEGYSEVFDDFFRPLEKGEAFNDTKQRYYIDIAEYEEVKKRLYDYIQEYHKSVEKRLEAGEEVKLVTTEERDKYSTAMIDDLKSVNKFNEFSYEDTNSITVRYQSGNEIKTESIKFGREIEYEYLDEGYERNPEEVAYLTKMYKSPLFKGMMKKGTLIDVVKSDDLDPEHNCFLIHLQNSDMIVSMEQIDKMLIKYELENEGNNEIETESEKKTAPVLSPEIFNEDTKKANTFEEIVEGEIPTPPELPPSNLEGYEDLFKENDYNTIIKDGELQVYNGSLVGVFKIEDGKFFGEMSEDEIPIYKSKNISMEELRAGLEKDFHIESLSDKEIKTPEISPQLVNCKEVIERLGFETSVMDKDEIIVKKGDLDGAFYYLDEDNFTGYLGIDEGKFALLEVGEVNLSELETKINDFTEEFNNDKDGYIANKRLEQCKKIIEKYGFETSINGLFLDIEKEDLRGAATYNEKNNSYTIRIDNPEESEPIIFIKEGKLGDIKTACEEFFGKEKKKQITGMDLMDSYLTAANDYKEEAKIAFDNLLKGYELESNIRNDEIQVDGKYEGQKITGAFETDITGNFTGEIYNVKTGETIYKAEDEKLDKIKSDLDKIFTKEADAGEDKDIDNALE